MSERGRETWRKKRERERERWWCFHCSLWIVATDGTLLYLHNATAACTLRNSRRNAGGEFLEWLLSVWLDVIILLRRLGCAIKYLFRSATSHWFHLVNFCLAKQIYKKKNAKGSETFFLKQSRARLFFDERKRGRRAGRRCDIRLLNSPTSFRSQTAERQFNIRMGRAEWRRVEHREHWSFVLISSAFTLFSSVLPPSTQLFSSSALSCSVLFLAWCLCCFSKRCAHVHLLHQVKCVNCQTTVLTDPSITVSYIRNTE